MLEQLRNCLADRLDLQQAVALSAFARTLRAEFEAHQIEEPDWLGEKIKMLHREIRAMNADAVAARLRSARARLEALRTPDEKRAQLQKEISELEALVAEG